MKSSDPITFMRLIDGTLLRREDDGSYHPTPSATDLGRVSGWSDEEIEEMSASDPDHPALDDVFWQQADARDAGRATVRLEAEIIEFFRRSGERYESRINAVLRDYVASQNKV